MFKALAGGLAALLLLAAPALNARAWAAPLFPPLTGRVVDSANILPAAVQAQLTTKLAQIEATTHHQVVVATIPDLGAYQIEDYGYQLGRTWGIGGKSQNDGVLLIVAPAQHKVRIEVGYGLEPILTDALSSVIIQSQILPKFKAGDMPGGIVAGVDAIGAQLGLPQDQALLVAQSATTDTAARHAPSGLPFAPILIVIVIFFVLSSLGRRGGLGGALPWLLLGAMSGRGGGWGGGGGGGFGGGGGGGFSGGGGSFGGGGASGGW